MITRSREQDLINNEINDKEKFFRTDSGQAGEPWTWSTDFFRQEPRQQIKANDGAIRHDRLDPKEKAIEYRLRQPISFKFKDLRSNPRSRS